MSEAEAGGRFIVATFHWLENLDLAAKRSCRENHRRVIAPGTRLASREIVGFGR